MAHNLKYVLTVVWTIDVLFSNALQCLIISATGLINFRLSCR